MLKLGINDVSNTEYHADNEYLSSSNYKTLLKDLEQFHREKILGHRDEKKTSASFEEGSLTHSMILEPHLVDSEYAVFPGLRKAGDAYEAFCKTVNDGRTIISRAQFVRCEGYKAAYLKNEAAKKLLKDGVPEQTICTVLNGIKTKARFDYINVEKGYIADVKTTSYPADVDTFRLTVKQWDYALSAALYAAVAEQHYGKKFDFYFVVIGKKESVCEVYRASDDTMQAGARQIAKAANIYRKCIETGIWKPDQAPSLTGEEILEV